MIWVALVCYHGENPHIINQERADVVLAAISDTNSRKIISTIKDEFKKVNQIAKDTSLPTSTVYRKVQDLHEKKLLITSGEISKYGKKEFTYKSKIQRVIMEFNNNNIDLKIYTNLRDE